jgi:hypothetical protein
MKVPHSRGLHEIGRQTQSISLRRSLDLQNASTRFITNRGDNLCYSVTPRFPMVRKGDIAARRTTRQSIAESMRQALCHNAREASRIAHFR